MRFSVDLGIKMPWSTRFSSKYKPYTAVNKNRCLAANIFHFTPWRSVYYEPCATFTSIFPGPNKCHSYKSENKTRNYVIFTVSNKIWIKLNKNVSTDFRYIYMAKRKKLIMNHVSNIWEFLKREKNVVHIKLQTHSGLSVRDGGLRDY